MTINLFLKSTKFLIGLIALVSIFFGFNSSVFAQSTVNTTDQQVLEGYIKSKEVAACKENPDARCEYVNILLLDATILPPISVKNELNQDQIVQDWVVGDRVIVVSTKKVDGTTDYYIRDPDRQIQLWLFVVIIIVVAFIIARFKGLMALLALALSTITIFTLFIPNILNGGNMIIWGFITTLIILTINQLVGHGFTKSSLIGLFSSVVTLIAAWVIGYLASYAFKLTGGAGDSIVFLRAEKGVNFDFRGLLLAGMMIGVTGAIDDVVAAQVSSTEEIVLNNRNIKFGELFSSSLRIGKEHIVSMINTLFLAYAGASLPLLLLFYMNMDQSITQLMSREDLAEEIVRTGVGSIALLLVVPLATFCAALFYKRPDWLSSRRKK
jgi:uncharacterized membrane protein